MPATGVETTGVPAASASSTAIDWPSESEETSSSVGAGDQLAGVGARAEEGDVAPARPRRLARAASRRRRR